MARLYIALCVLSAAALGCASRESLVQHSTPLPISTPLLDDDEVEGLDCDLCRRGQAGENLWCDECSVGFIGGERIAGEACFSCKIEGESVCGQCKDGSVDEGHGFSRVGGQQVSGQKVHCKGEC